MEKVNVVLDWFPNTNHTGLLLAQKRGWFKEAGLDVTIRGDVHGVMETQGADFVLGPEISMLDCRQKGTPLIGIAVLTQKCDSGIVSLKSAGITRPRELEGKRLTHWAPAWFHAAIRQVMAQDGGDYDKVQLVPLDVGDIVATLGQAADATWVYENWENQVLLEAGREINYFNLGDFDPIFDFCAPAIAAPEAVLETRPAMVRTFLGILDRAYRLAASNPEDSVREVRSFMPAGCSEQLLIRSQRHLAPILLDAQGRWGRIRPERWDRMAGFLLTCGVITQRWDCEYTNDYFADGQVSQPAAAAEI
ncbi:ABC transporter substrate-binding protein [Oscillospiraceae bacterium HV4-5-C5C]|nr:ABC transporter substrate-binding protein [Oscillospiraceae bacterium HV4-5-C5C]